MSGEEYAVKIIDTASLNLVSGISLKELREEANLMKKLDHVRLPVCFYSRI